MWQGGTVGTRLRALIDDERTRFVLVGGVNTVIGYSLFALAQVTLGEAIGYLGSLALSYAVAVIIAFFLHRRFTFRVQGTGSPALDLVRFIGVNLAVLGVNAVVLAVLVEVAGLPPLGAQAIALVVATVLSYLGHRFISFRRRSGRRGDLRTR